MGIGDRTAFPPHLDEQHEVEANFKDDDTWWMRWRKRIKHWNAFGYRSPKGLAFSHLPPFVLLRKWRSVPKVLKAKKGPGYWRFEADGKPDLWTDDTDPRPFLKLHPEYYLSRNQYWCEWHEASQWPSFRSAHMYKDPKDVLPVGTKADRDGKIRMMYEGAKRDADGIYWLCAAYAGENFK